MPSPLRLFPWFLAPALAAQGVGGAFPTLQELAQVRVLVASKNLESTPDSPSTLTVFTRAEMRRMGVRSLTDLLNLVPGVQALFEPTEGRDNLLQGRGTPEAYGQSFLLLLDGQRLNEHYTGGFTLANRFIALGNLERVEIIRGPGSALYGSNAFNGVINLVTTRTTDDVTLEATDPEGGRLGLNLHGTVGALEGSGFLQVERDAGDRYEGVFDRFGLQTRTRDPRRSLDAYTRLSWEGAFLQLRHTEHRLEDFYVFRRLDDGWNLDRSSQSHLRLGTEVNPTEGLTGTLAASFMRTTWTYDGRLALAGTDPADLLSGSRLVHDAMEVTADFAWDLGEGHRLNAGASHEQAEIPVAATRSNFDPISGAFLGPYTEFRDGDHRFVEDRARNLHGVYLQHQARWNDQWSSTLGLRHDRYNDVGSSTNPRFALIYAPAPADRLKLMVGTAFRAPGLGDLYDRDAGVTLGNPHLGPIRVRTTELAYQHQGEGWQAALTGFENVAHGLLSDVLLPSGKLQVENVGSHHDQGFEGEFAREFGEDWLIRGSFTRITHNETLDLPDPSAFTAEAFGPHTFGSLVLNRNLGDWNLNLSGFWRDRIPVLGRGGSATVLNLAVVWEARPGLQVKATILNLLDQAYDTPTRGTGLGTRPDGTRVRNLPQRGRQVALGLTWRL